MKRPAFQFYPADWRKDAALQSCSPAARGLWIEMICLMHECEPYGHLAINGTALSDAQAARMVGFTPKEYRQCAGELEAAGVLSRNAAGVIYSRRMVKDEALRNTRAAGGAAGASHGVKGRDFGGLGGRPKQSTTGDKKPPLPPTINPPPSSSASASASSMNGLPNSVTTVAVDKSQTAEPKTGGDKSPSTPKPTGADWKRDPDAAARKGREIGCEPRVGESQEQFVGRLTVALAEHYRGERRVAA